MKIAIYDRMGQHVGSYAWIQCQRQDRTYDTAPKNVDIKSFLCGYPLISRLHIYFKNKLYRKKRYTQLGLGAMLFQSTFHQKGLGRGQT